MRPYITALANRLTLLQYWLVAQLSFGIMGLLRLAPADKALNFADYLARKLGPLASRHQVALDNLAAAYPEKTPEEHHQIALDMWGNMGRLAAEYVFLDKLFDFDPEGKRPSRIEVNNVDLFLKLRAEDKARIFITGHLGNFEFLPIAAASYGLDMSSMFRPPNNPYIADYILNRREGAMGGLIASRQGVAFTVARLLEKKGNVGVLVDQHFMHGVKTTFFGRACETSPLVAKLTRNFENDVHPARCIRLPNNRYRLEIFDKIEIPKDENGRLDVAAMTQQLNDIVEDWVREDPGQWMWFHKRWKIRPPKQRPYQKTS